MKKYIVMWSEDHKVEVEADNEEMAREMIMTNEYDESNDNSEIVDGLQVEETE